MIGEVNRKVSEDRRFRYFGFSGPRNVFQVDALHGQFYPGSRLRLAFRALVVLNAVLGLSFFASFLVLR